MIIKFTFNIVRNILRVRPFQYYAKTLFSTSRSSGDDFILEEPDELDRDYEQLAKRFFDCKEHSCFIIHPFVKWGPKKVKDTTPEYQISEAIALVDTLSNWKVYEHVSIPLETLSKKQLFGSGNLKMLRDRIRSDPSITSVFINTGVLKPIQAVELQAQFGVPVFDRYTIVMQIFKQHAISMHAKLQVSLAEIPYLRARLKEICSTNGLIYETQQKILNDKEVKIRNQIKKLRSHRELMRNKRKQLEFPVVAVVGYTNAGKTSLIKALTGENQLEPRDQLFATLDVTIHKGMLPSRMEVLYVDTVGFISNIPTNLIECFIATLEDAILADVILHVQDLSNPNVEYQSKHVGETLKNLSDKIGVIGSGNLIDRVIAVGNKIDRIEGRLYPVKCDVAVSASNFTGIDVLRQEVENAIIKATGKKTLTIRIPIGGDEIRWLYKNATIIEEETDPKDVQFQNVTIVISESKIHQFYHNFVSS